MTGSSVLTRIRRHPLATPIEGPSGAGLVHAVGGIVRDAVLGFDSADLDLSVARDGERLAGRVAAASGGKLIALGGDRFSSYRVVAGEFQADIWDRGGGSLESDLERRDLTINAIACALDGSGLEDPFGGLEDLSRRILRATRTDCFDRDPLRVLRLTRFRLSLAGFAIDPATASAARAAASGLERVANERIRDELHRILGAASAARAFRALEDLGALEALAPATAAPPALQALLGRARRLDLALATLDSARVAGVENGVSGWSPDQRRGAALAMLALAAGAGDLVAGAAELGRRELATRAELSAACRLCSEKAPIDEPARRLFLDRHREDWPLALAASVAAEERNRTDLRSLAEDLGRTAETNPDLVRGILPLLDGHQAARILGLAPGPALGEALRALGRAQALGAVVSTAQAEDFLRERGSRPSSKPSS